MRTPPSTRASLSSTCTRGENSAKVGSGSCSKHASWLPGTRMTWRGPPGLAMASRSLCANAAVSPSVPRPVMSPAWMNTSHGGTVQS